MFLVFLSSAYLEMMPKKRQGREKKYPATLILLSPMLLFNYYVSVHLIHSFHLTTFIPKGYFISLLQNGTLGGEKTLQKQIKDK